MTLIDQIKEKVQDKPFVVSFTKRTTGEIRVMTCSLDYSELTSGGTAKYSPSEKSLLVVKDLEKEAIRSIPVDTIETLIVNIDGEEKLIFSQLDGNLVPVI